MSTKIETKYMSRSDWKRILSRETAYTDISSDDMRGEASLLHIIKVTKPLAVFSVDHDIMICDDGYYWLQLAFENKNWWLTVMFNPADECFQYYIDITKQNIVDGESSCFDDLMLDIIVQPDGRSALLDMDELTEALAQGNISEEDYSLALKTSREMLDGLKTDFCILRDYCTELFSRLVPDLK